MHPCYYIRPEITNHGTYTSANMSLTIYFYDENNTLLTYKTRTIEALSPGETRVLGLALHDFDTIYFPIVNHLAFEISP